MIRKTKDGQYCILARIRYNGKIVTKRETVACSKEEAIRKLEQFKTELRAGNPNSSLTDTDGCTNG